MQERKSVLNLYDVLRELGHKVFLDQVVLKAGDQLTQRLEKVLPACKAGVLIWSNAARDSDWVSREYQAMERLASSKKDFQFVPVKLDNSELPLFADNRIFLDFSSYPDGPNGGELLRLLHAIVGLPLSDQAARFANEQDEAARIALARIETSIKNKDYERLLQLWAAGGLPWKTSAALGCKAVEGHIRLKRNQETINMLEELHMHFPKAIRPKQLLALALARRGEKNDLSTAQQILGELYELGERDPETVGIYARTWMDRYAQSKDLQDLKQSRDLYAEAFEQAQDDYYTGINAAAKSIFLGNAADLKRAAKYAKQVQKIVGTKLYKGDYWKTATAAEALLIQGKYEEAGALYEAAVAMSRSERGSHESTWLQACRLMNKLQPNPEESAMIRAAFEDLQDCQQA
jgi:tetratricopeptide (TPR) repeat protein